MAQKGNKIDLQTLKRVLALATPYKHLFALASFLAIVIAPVSIVRPYLINQMVDVYIFNVDLQGLAKMALILIAFLFLEAILRYFFIYSTALLGQSSIRDLRVRVFKHLLSLKLTYFDRTPVGQSTTRTINDIETINQVFTQGVIAIIADVLGLVAVISIMLYTSWQLTLVVLITFPVLLVGSYIFKEKVKKAFQIVRAQISRMNAFLQERITGMQVVQIFNAEEQEMEKFKKINREYTQANLNSILYYAIFFPFVEIVRAAALGLMVWYGARGVLDESITLGVLVAFPIYISMLFRPIRMIADKFNTLQMGLVAGERVFKVIDTKDKIEDNGAIKPEKLDGRIEFEKVDFSYKKGNRVLKNINFSLDAGETLAIVGSTGSGKTTVINILNRFYEIENGTVRIDGTDIRTYDLEAYRRRLAMVLQDVFLFGGTIYENITLRNPNISLDDVRAAAKMIGAHDFFERLPDGYNFVITERGSNLSMGQRQLVSFVRALVFDPDILILDEATSSIDSETEAIIQYAIEQLIEKRTSIIIAHRLSTIQHADKIMVLDQGEIIEMGAHEELLKNENGHYRELYENQFIQSESVPT